jgi:hypothetical protein
MKKIKINIIFLFVLFAFSFAFFPKTFAAISVNSGALYSGGNLAGQTPGKGLEPNTSIVLSYTLEGSGNSSPCVTPGHKVFYALWDVIKSKFVKNGEDTSGGFYYEFTTGNPIPPSTEKFDFIGYFYCYSQDIAAMSQSAKPNNLSIDGPGQAWTSPEFSGQTVIRRYKCDTSNNTCSATTDGTGTSLAACQPTCGSSNGTSTPGGSTGSGGANDQIYNPLPTDTLTETFLMILRGFILIIAIWAVLFIVVGGFQMVMSSGNEEAVTKAKKTITWAVLGLVVALLSFAIIAIVQNLLKAKINY